MSEEARRFYEARPWLANYDDGVAHRLDYPGTNLPELFSESAERHAERVALRFMGRSVSYEELKRTATAIARRLCDLGVESGDRVLIEGYGLTETVTAKTASPFRGIKKRRSVGLAWPDVEALIVDPEGGDVLDSGCDGELLLRSPDLMSGYWKAETATAEVLKDGYLFIVDRKKDLIICGGHNVYPTEVEEHLPKLPEVKLSCVVGIADDYMGEVPKAFIELQPGAELSAERIRAYLEQRLTGYKVPRHYEFREELPTSPIGKVLRKQLRAEAGVRVGLGQ